MSPLVAPQTEVARRIASIRIFASLKLNSSRAVAEMIRRHSGFLDHPDEQIRKRRRQRSLHVPVALKPPRGSPGNHSRKYIVTVNISVAHAAAVQNHRMIEQIAIAIRRGPQLFEELREQR